MTTVITNLRKTGLAAALALSLGFSALSAAPVQAQPSGPSVNFSIELDAPSGERRSGTTFHNDDEEFEEDYCLTDRQIRRGLREFGFENVRIGRELRFDRVEVIANWGRALYSMRVDRCTGEVDRVRRISRNRGGIGLQFEFGN